MTPRVEADTPLMQQYREIKARHPDTILFFRMGDFYEMFEDDAQLAARELGLTLTSRNNGGAAEVALAGVPAKAATEYLRRLIGLGHRVAICEQVEDPALPTGPVRPAVVAPVTPATLLADAWLEGARNNFLLAVQARRPRARPRMLRRGDVRPLDEMTRRKLELVEPLRAQLPGSPGAAGTTLLDVLDRTMTPMGARLLRSWLLAPLVDPTAITARLDAVEVLVGDARGRDRVREALDGVRDVERLAGRAALGRATPRELGALRDSILRLPDVRAALDGLEARGRASLLEEAADRLDLLQDLGDELTRALVERPPAQASDGDAIRAGYDHELDELKDARDGGKQYIAGLQTRERERTGISSLKVGFNKVFGYYLEITNPHRDRVPAGYERRQTLSGAERFVTPELKAYEAKVLGAEEGIAAREAQLVDALRVRVAQAVARRPATAGVA